MTYRFNVLGFDLAQDPSHYTFASDREALSEGVKLLEELLRDQPEALLCGGQVRIDILKHGESVGCLTVTCQPYASTAEPDDTPA